MYTVIIDKVGNYAAHLEFDGKVIKIVLPDELPALPELINIRIDDKQVSFNKGNIEVELPEGSEYATIEISIESRVLATGILLPKSGDLTIHTQDENNLLTTHELRAISQWQHLPVRKHDINPEEHYKIRTDLHTHLPAAVRAKNLFNIATNDNTQPYYYPNALLEKMRIKTDSYKKYTSMEFKQQRDELGIGEQTHVDQKLGDDKTYVNLLDLSQHDRKNFISALSIPQNRQIIFDQMESYYDLRMPMTKDIHLFEKILWSVANDYQDIGIEAASVSFGRCTDPKYLKIIHRVLPEIEKKTHVKIRFLASIARTNTPEERAEKRALLQAMGKSPYIEGVDFLASETNSTFEFYDDLHLIAQWAQANDPGFVIRVHAGENSYHPENVRSAMAISEQYGIKMRIGHGIYGVDETTLELAKKLSAQGLVIIEMNPDSNFALNSIDSVKNYPLTIYAENNVAVILGSDGHGLYQSDPQQLIHYLQYLDGNPQQIIKAIQVGEQKYIQLSKLQFDEKLKHHETAMAVEMGRLKKRGIEGNDETLKELAFDVLYKPPAVDQKNRMVAKNNYTARKQEKLSNIIETFNSNMIKFEESEVIHATAEKLPIMITGALLDYATLEDFEHTQALINTLLDNIDPKNAYIVTTGNNYGVQKLVHESVAVRNTDAKEGDQISLVGYVAKSARPEDISPLLTHATLGYEKWYDLHEYVTKKITNDKLQIVAIGGGMLTRDVIQASYNIVSQCDPTRANNNLYLVENIPGASHDKTQHLPAQYRMNLNNIAGQLFSKHQHTRKIFKNCDNEAQLNAYFQSEAETLSGTGTTIKEQQGRHNSVTTHDHVRWFMSAAKRINVPVKESDVFDYFAKDHPPDHQIAKIIAAYPEGFSNTFLDILEIKNISKSLDSKQENISITQSRFFNQSKEPKSQKSADEIAQQLTKAAELLRKIAGMRVSRGAGSEDNAATKMREIAGKLDVIVEELPKPTPPRV